MSEQEHNEIGGLAIFAMCIAAIFLNPMGWIGLAIFGWAIHGAFH